MQQSTIFSNQSFNRIKPHFLIVNKAFSTSKLCKSEKLLFFRKKGSLTLIFTIFNDIFTQQSFLCFLVVLSSLEVTH